MSELEQCVEINNFYQLMGEFIMLFLFQTTGGPGAIRAGGGGTIPINDIRGTLSLLKDNSSPDHSYQLIQCE